MAPITPDEDRPISVRLEEREDGFWYVVASATVMAADGDDFSDVEARVEAEAIRASHIAAGRQLATAA